MFPQPLSHADPSPVALPTSIKKNKNRQHTNSSARIRQPAIDAAQPINEILHTCETLEATQVIPALSKKRPTQTTRVIKDARQRTMDAYIHKRTLAEEAKAGVSISTCHDLSELDLLPAAMISNHSNIDFSPSPKIENKNPSIDLTTTTTPIENQHVEPTTDHDKRYVFI